MFIKARCGTLKDASRLKVEYCTRAHVHIFRDETWRRRGRKKTTVPGVIRSISLSVLFSGVQHQNKLDLSHEACVRFHTVPSPPLQIPPKSQRFPALSHTYCSVAYLVKPANIRSLLRGPFQPAILWQSWNSVFLLSRRSLRQCHRFFFPSPCHFCLSFLPPHSDWMLNHINSHMSGTLIVPLYWCH